MLLLPHAGEGACFLPTSMNLEQKKSFFVIEHQCPMLGDER